MAKAQSSRSGLMGRLSEKSHEELLALLEQLVQRQPDIEPLIELLIELPLVTTTQQKKRPGRGKAYIAHLRNSNKSLRALKEELDKRGL
jgi:hypothetical protein